MRSKSRWHEKHATSIRGAFLTVAAFVTVPSALSQDATVQPLPGADSLALGRRLFSSGATPACSICHTLRDASATGEVGPSLDQIRPDAGRVAKALRNGVGAMPSYRERLTEDQIEALARYVSNAAGD